MIALIHDGLDTALATGWVVSWFRGRRLSRISRLCKQVASSTPSAWPDMSVMSLETAVYRPSSEAQSLQHNEEP